MRYVAAFDKWMTVWQLRRGLRRGYDGPEKTPLIIDSEMWFIVNAGRLKSFLTLSKSYKSLTAFLVLLKELKGQKEANL